MFGSDVKGQENGLASSGTQERILLGRAWLLSPNPAREGLLCFRCSDPAAGRAFFDNLGAFQTSGNLGRKGYNRIARFPILGTQSFGL